MDAGQDHLWLSGDEDWGGSAKQPSPGDDNSGLPKLWPTPSDDSAKGWLRQTLRPIAPRLLLPMAWSPFFLVITAVPLILPDRAPIDDQTAVAVFFTLSWLLILVPLYLFRSSQPTHVGSLQTLPFDWLLFTLACLVFGLHVLINPILGWVSYGLFWLAWFRTYTMIRDVAIKPSGRWLLPVNPSSWNATDGLSDGWDIVSEFWTSAPIARLNVDSGQIILTGVSRGDDRFLALSLIGPAGFVHDPFADNLAYEALSEEQVTITGLDWPTSLRPS